MVSSRPVGLSLRSLGVLFNPYIDSGDYHKGKIDQGDSGDYHKGKIGQGKLPSKFHLSFI